MIERVKSVVLAVLMLTSLLLTSLLWYSSPNAEELDRNNYIPQQAIGEPVELEQLVLPRTLVFHSGTGRHALVFADNQLYDRIVSSLHDWRVLQTKKRVVSKKEWERQLQHAQGWELRFPTSLPTSLFVNRLLPDLKNLEEQHWIDRIWIYRERGEMFALFISDLENSVYESKIVIESGDDFLWDPDGKMLAVNPILSTETSARGEAPAIVNIQYFPVQPLVLPERQAALKSIELDHMKNLLFLDPSLVRAVTNHEDNTTIMQDGSRSVRYVKANRMLYYQNYKKSVDSKSIATDLRQAIKFVNQNGAWMGDHFLVVGEGVESAELANRYAFRALQHGLPVYDKKNKNRYDTLLTVESEGGQVLRYSRSLYYPSQKSDVTANRTVTAGGDDLQHLMKNVDLRRVRDMFPAYEAVTKKGKGLLYVPGWRIQYIDGTEDWFSPPVKGKKG
ncbi:two-component system activity regulator YycH [Numidum massiliense]|uniref:two-component system activity regulator YycH n=1 Tax=Numidum massiliense TaxID=1522315 RepID=UPI0006D5882F|nr:two-component system activity regulator YycH [Numidum massiliense]